MNRQPRRHHALKVSKCCGANGCTCAVTAGPGVTVDGNGSPTNPYIVSADAADPTALGVTDTNSVDLSLSGTGTTGDPYQVSADVRLDATPTQGGTNLVGEGADGLFVECADVRGCFTGDNGITYDDTTGLIEARTSTDAGNSVTFGTDGGLYAPTGSAGTVVQAGDTTTVDTTVSGTGAAGDPYVVSSDVIVDPAPPAGGTNLLQSGPDGLHVECADVRGCISAGDGASYDPATGEIAARLSADTGNTVSFGSDGGLYSAGGGGGTPTALQAADTPTLDAHVTGTGTAGDPYVVSGDVIVAPEPNGVEVAPTGLLVTPSADTGNRLGFGGDGRLFVPPVPPPEVGCGLQGDGTAASPLAAFPIAGSQPWTDNWDCDPVANSTLKCDPSNGALWTPPEHSSAAATLQQNHPLVTPTIGVTGFILVDSTAWAEGTYTADRLSPCRGISFSTRFTRHVELTWPANAQFDLGYAIQINGGALAVRQTHSVLANGPARHERYSFGVSQAVVLPPHTSYSVRVYPAIRVIAGTVTINQWITDTDLIGITR